MITRADVERILKANLLSAPKIDLERRAETIFAAATRMFSQLAAEASSEEELSFDQFRAVAKLFPNVFYSSALYGAPK